jgi:glycosyltransferase involved in cell wall biosynthesis/putative flippase GtrA
MLIPLKRLINSHILRYALVGGIGIPINLTALAVFLHALGDGLYPIALACSFEVSTTINFILNQFYTYGEQKHLRGLDWIRRALKAQATSASALLVTYVIALIFKYGVHVNPYVASTVGIVTAFFYNFLISKRFVFKPDESRQLGRKQEMQFPKIPNTELPVFVNEPVFLASNYVSTATMLSFVIPVMNEMYNVRPLYEKLASALERLGHQFEIIFVDDGSTDGTFEELQKLHYEHSNMVYLIRFRRNFGKTPALVAGFSRSRGEVVFTMDGDLQDDPEEIPQFLAKLDEGYDLVTGWKYPRHDPLSKTFPSRIFNGLVNRLTGLRLHDINCGFKAYRREVIEDIHLKLYGEFHRFVPVMAHWRGFRVAEIKVRHHPRTSGVSKFGARRFARGLIDLLTVWFLTSSLHTPLRLFGKVGFWTFMMGIAVDVFVVARSFVTLVPIHDQPLLFVGILLMIFGFLFILIGLLGEMIRYYAFQSGEEYSIRQEQELRRVDRINEGIVPTVVHVEQVIPLVGEQPFSVPLFQPKWQQSPQVVTHQNNGERSHPRSRNIPRRPTMIPM